jgi:hypothetical protein
MQRQIGETMPETASKTVTIAKRRFELRSDRVESALRQVLPEPITSHYVVIGRRRYPPKQAIGLVTGLDRADFTSHQARRVLMGLGFPVGRRREASPDAPSQIRGGAGLAQRPAASDADSSKGPAQGLAETLMAFQGQWVAIKDEELLVAAPSPRELVGWLARHDRRADSMFRVPEDELALGGLAPL